ncbi:MAG: hypothetical protein HZC54_24700 [Verrucomicrobia bacterium]|nr:hypothetical protein [Verrucomicrobiota bacterium]
MIAREEVERVVARNSKPGSPMLSVYLDVDPTQEVNRQRGFEPALKNMLRTIEGQLNSDRERKVFAGNALRVMRFVSGYKPTAQGLVMFGREADGFFWHRELHAPLRNDAHWDDSPHLRPLLETMDDYERYGVILTDKARARLFTVFLGEIEEHSGVFTADDVRHTKTVGTDHWRSQTHFERTSDLHALWHLKQVAEKMVLLADARRFDRLVLAGPVEATTELERLLPKRLLARLAGSMALSVEATGLQVLEATRRFERPALREMENDLVKKLIATAAKKVQADTGLLATLNALNKNRVWRLLYAEGFAPQGRRCADCTALMGEGQPVCDHCGGNTEPVGDLIERIVERVVGVGGKVEAVRGPAAELLKEAGSIGAFMRF